MSQVECGNTSFMRKCSIGYFSLVEETPFISLIMLSILLKCHCFLKESDIQVSKTFEFYLNTLSLKFRSSNIKNKIVFAFLLERKWWVLFLKLNKSTLNKPSLHACVLFCKMPLHICFWCSLTRKGLVFALRLKFYGERTLKCSH